MIRDSFTYDGLASPLGIGLVYVTVGGIWVFLTDVSLINRLSYGPSISVFHTVKELIYIGFSGVGLFFLVQWGTTRLRMSRESLRERNAVLEALVEAAPLGIIVLDADLRIQVWSQKAEELFGRSEDEVHQQLITDFVSIQAGDMEQLCRWALVGKEVDERADWFETPDGDVFAGSWSAIPLSDGGRASQGLELVLSDITRREERKRQLRLLKAAVEQANDAVLITDANLQDESGPRLIYANPAFQEMSGYNVEWAIGRSPQFLVGEETDPRSLGRIQHALEQRNVIREELINYTRDGLPYWVEVNVAPVSDEAGECTHFVSVHRNVTERKEWERELVQARDRAQEMHRMKSTFLKNMSHEIRTPLTSIIGFSELLLQESDGEQREFAQFIHVSGQRLARTLNDVLLLAKLEGDSVPLKLTRVDFQKTLASFISDFDGDKYNSGLTLRFDPGPGPMCIMADENLLEHIIDNLLTNAFKFTPEGAVTVKLGRSEEYACVEVEDTGIGISEDFLPHVFDEFEQESRGLTREYPGSGLGLAVVRSLVEKMGGHISAKSTKGQGSTFTVALPLAS